MPGTGTGVPPAIVIVSWVNLSVLVQISPSSANESCGVVLNVQDLAELCDIGEVGLESRIVFAVRRQGVNGNTGRVEGLLVLRVSADCVI